MMIRIPKETARAIITTNLIYSYAVHLHVVDLVTELTPVLLY
jgi:hypothetical protein